MFQNLRTTIISNPAGSFSIVGSVPVACLDVHEMTAADAMAGRMIETPEGRKGWKARAFKTLDEAREALAAAGVTDYDISTK